VSEGLIGPVNGRYHIEALLGVGGMGAVYRARDKVTGGKVALKLIREDLLEHEELAARFRREARAASRIDHPHVTRVLDFGQDERNRAFIVMELVEGPLLSQAIALQGRFSVERALHILGQLARALAAAHACQVIHRDLKPGNVVLAHYRDELEHVKILDFGLAKIQGLDSTSVVTPLGETFGTAEYISPEQAADLPLDHRADIYSFGVLAFELLTGQVPFTGDTVDVVTAHVHRPPPRPSEVALDQGISPGLEAMVLRCLAKQPDERYASADDLARVIDDLCTPPAPQR